MIGGLIKGKEERINRNKRPKKRKGKVQKRKEYRRKKWERASQFSSCACCEPLLQLGLENGVVSN